MTRFQNSFIINLTYKDFCQGRFPLSVLSYKSNFVFPVHFQIYIAQDLFFTVTFRNIFCFYNNFSGHYRHGKAYIHYGCILFIHFNTFHFIEFFDKGLSHRCFGCFCSKLVDKFFGALDFFLLVFLSCQLLFPQFFSLY